MEKTLHSNFKVFKANISETSDPKYCRFGIKEIKNYHSDIMEFYFLIFKPSNKGYIIPVDYVQSFFPNTYEYKQSPSFAINTIKDITSYYRRFEPIKDYLVKMPKTWHDYELPKIAEKHILSKYPAFGLKQIIEEDIEAEKDIEKYEQSIASSQKIHTGKEGAPRMNYVRTYERSPILRLEAIKIHGLTCMACGFNFEETYGKHGKNYIEVHHIDQVSKLIEETEIDPEKGMVVLCSNCHKITHRKRDKALTLEELRNIIKTQK